MIKCSNCDSEAIYTRADAGVNPVNYCNTCIPNWLRIRAAAGHFPLIDPTAGASKKSKSKKTPAEEAPADANN